MSVEKNLLIISFQKNVSTMQILCSYNLSKLRKLLVIDNDQKYMKIIKSSKINENEKIKTLHFFRAMLVFTFKL